MPQDYILLKDFSEKLGMDKSAARKYVLKSGYVFEKVRTSESGNQLSLALTIEDAEAIIQLRTSNGFAVGEKPGKVFNGDSGFFYFIQLIPEALPNRIKLGFASDLDSRIQAHKTTSPTLNIIKYWNCKRTWEDVAISSITRIESKLIGGEVYDFDNLDCALERANVFFSIMPNKNGGVIENEIQCNFNDI